MEDIFEISQMPEGEKIYLKKSLGEWKIVKPIRNEDGSINWFNFIFGGSWLNFWSMVIIVAIICGFFYEYHSGLEYCNSMLQNITV